MSNYTKSTNFATKDNLTPGDPLKVVRGTEIDTEYNNIATAIATKTDNASAAITGGTITGITDLAVADGGTGASTAAGALNNLLPSQTSAANKYLQSDGTNASWDAVTLSTADITGTLAVANGGTGVTTSTGTTNVVLSNSPTLVTPALGTPSALVGTNITGTASGLTAGNVTTNANLTGAVTSVGNATSLGSFSSANLLAALTDETGTGSAVFATSPTLVTPALGTPSALVGTNITGTASGLTAGNVTTNANLTGAVTSVGNATSLGSFSSANLLGALTDETGTGSAVFATSPTLVTPILGTPTSATLTNATGLPIATGVSGLGTGIATALAVNTGSSGAPVINGGVLGTPSSGTLTNATGLPLTTGVTGTLPTANGGTNLTSFTSGGVVYASSSSVLATGSAFNFNGTKVSIGTTEANRGLNVYELNNTANSTTSFWNLDYAGLFVRNTSTTTNTLAGIGFSGGTSGNSASGIANILESVNAGALGFYTGGASAGNTVPEKMRITSNGDVGIGTSSPSHKLEVKGGNGNQLILDNAGEAYTQMTFKSNGTNRAAIWATAAELGLYTYSTQSLIFYTNTTERARLNTTGAFVFAGGTTTADGIGITFPATQSASSNANTLDDYEEGTWTPVIGGATSESGQTYSGQTGNYTKVGRLVTVNFRVALSAKGTITGDICIKGLPFTVQNSITFGAGVTYFGNMGANFTYLYLSASANNTRAFLEGTKTAVATAININTSDILDNAQFNGSLTYFAD